MNSFSKFRIIKKIPVVAYRYVVAIVLTAIFFWPWITFGTDEVSVADLSTIVSLGMLSVIVVGSIIVYLETRKHNWAYRMAVGLALATAFIMNWMIPAVGILGVDGDPADLLYIGVFAVGLTGAIFSNFLPLGMARALAAAALAQMLVAVIALIAGMHLSPVSSVFEILGLNGFFAALWVGSALLFWYAAKEQVRS